MKTLKIEDGKGLYLTGSGEYLEIDKIDKDGLYHLVDLALESECEVDEFSPDLIPNQAHQIIYRNIHEKITELMDRKEEFRDRSERLYLNEYERYSSELPQPQAEKP